MMQWGKDSLKAAANDYALQLDSLVGFLTECALIVRRVESIHLPPAEHDLALRTFRKLADEARDSRAAFSEGLTALRDFEIAMKRASID
jgi:hypothetical protein